MKKISIARNSLKLLVIAAGTILLTSTFAQFANAAPMYNNIFKATCGGITDTQTGSVKFTFIRINKILGSSTINCVGLLDNDSKNNNLLTNQKPTKWVMEISIQDGKLSVSKTFRGNNFDETSGTTRSVTLGLGELAGKVLPPQRI